VYRLLHGCSIIVDQKLVDLRVLEVRQHRYRVLRQLAGSTCSEQADQRAVELGRRMQNAAAAAAAATATGRCIGTKLTSRFLCGRSLAVSVQRHGESASLSLSRL